MNKKEGLKLHLPYSNAIEEIIEIDRGIKTCKVHMPFNKDGVGRSPFFFVGQMIDRRPHGFGMAVEERI